MPKKLNQTKRERSKLIQAWIDTGNDDELRVLHALDKLCDKRNINVRQAIMQSILFTAEHDQLTVEKPYSMIAISRMFKSILEKIDNMVSSGAMQHSQASDLVSAFGGSGVSYEDLDPAARSLASNYVSFNFEDDED